MGIFKKLISRPAKAIIQAALQEAFISAVPFIKRELEDLVDKVARKISDELSDEKDDKKIPPVA